MTITLVDPDNLPAVDLYRQVSIATGSRLVFVAGQVAVDPDGNTVGVGDFPAQVEQCYLNLHTALSAAGASFDDIAKLTVYIPNWNPANMPLFAEGIARAATRLGVEPPAAPLTGIGVAALAGPDLLMEVEATAVVGD